MVRAASDFVAKLNDPLLPSPTHLSLKNPATSADPGPARARNLAPVAAAKQCKSKPSPCNRSAPVQPGTGESWAEMACSECLEERGGRLVGDGWRRNRPYVSFSFFPSRKPDAGNAQLVVGAQRRHRREFLKRWDGRVGAHRTPRPHRRRFSLPPPLTRLYTRLPDLLMR